MSKLDRIKTALAKLIVNFSTQKTDKGIIGYETGEELKEGDTVYIVGEEGEQLPIEDGEYMTEDNKVISVTDGKVVSIVEKEEEKPQEEEEKPTEEMEDEKPIEEEKPQEDETPAEDENKEEEEKPIEEETTELEDVKADVSNLYKVLGDLVSVVEELKTKIESVSLAKPAQEEFEQIKETAKDKRSARLKGLFE